jgi:hypothetical protein
VSKSTSEIKAALFAVFDPNEVQWKPQTVKGDRALAVAYIDARSVMDRLDDVVGPDNWSDEYEMLVDGSVMCKLQVRFGSDWILKMDVGSPSEQPDSGDRLKAAFSDALKRAAVKFGIARYLYALPMQWLAYDPHKRQFAEQPKMPKWALPTASQLQPQQSAPPQQSPATKATQNVYDRIKSGMQKLRYDWSEVATHICADLGIDLDPFASKVNDLTLAEADKVLNVLMQQYKENQQPQPA